MYSSNDDSIILFPLQNFTKFVSVFSSIQQTQAVMVYHINHDEVEMNNIPLLTVEPVAELLRANGEICFPSSRENTASILSHCMECFHFWSPLVAGVLLFF